jgi:hypothetical protein
MKRASATTKVWKPKFYAHRSLAKGRGIPFLMTFEQWLQIWESSDHLHERGRRRGQYVMARYGDRGAYEVGNVRTITVEENGAEMEHPGREPSAETRARIGTAMKSAHERRRRSGLPPPNGGKYKPPRPPPYWDFQDGRGVIEEREFTREEKRLVAMAKRVRR